MPILCTRSSVGQKRTLVTTVVTGGPNVVDAVVILNGDKF